MADIEQKNLKRIAKQLRAAVQRERKAGSLLQKKKPTESEEKRIRTRMSLISPNDSSGLERVIGTRDIVGIGFLQRGLIAARAVCRINVRGTHGEPPTFGTGFQIASGLIVTNHHVLPDENTASFALAEFDYELDLNWVECQRRIFSVVPSYLFYTDPAIDITIVSIAPVAHDGTPITEFGTLKLIAESGKALPGEHVSIIQHPEGGPKQVVMRENSIITLDSELYGGQQEQFIHYTADTEPGSSGSPVFNDQWDLVAVHHKAIPDYLPSGEPKNLDRKVWTAQQGEGQRAWIANEGVRASAIARSILKSRDDNPDAARISTILSFEPTIQMRSAPCNQGTICEVEHVDLPELPAFESTRFTDKAFLASTGFDPNFLGKLKVELPKPAKNSGDLKKNLFLPTGAKSPVLDYTHFSLVMHKSMKLTLWTAVNIDGKHVFEGKSKDGGWRKDPRAEDCQTLGAIYGKNRGGKGVQVDKGHQVRRLDPVWGSPEVARRAAEDTFHYTNAVPQEHFFNSELWGNLEDFVLERAINQSQKVSVLTGPVLKGDVPTMTFGAETFHVPSQFWKICIFIRSDNTPCVAGFVMEQLEQIAPLFEANRFNPFRPDEVMVFQKSITEIEKLTGLDFGSLKKLDKKGVVESTGAKPRPLRGREEIMF